MKSLLLLAIVLAQTAAFADDAKSLLVQPGKVVAQPDLKQPLGKEWSVRKGTWEAKDGELVCAEVPADKHSAVLWHQVGLQSAVIECEFQLDGGKVFIIGCDSAKGHVGRVTITPKLARITEDASAVKGKTPPKTLAEAALDLKPGQWYSARLVWTGDKMAACVAGKEIRGQHANLAAPKARWWFAVGGAKVHLKNVKACEGK
ncbi:MAG: hypothetical protein HZA91_14000 [Verrucomicrobia bacterium]|nr:hypothetical protein [Verrucomicrobiota bacterium]